MRGGLKRVVATGASAVRDDARLALRLMVKTRGGTAVAVLMLALGTGANAALFSVVDAVMLRSPYGRLEEIAQVGTLAPNGRATVAVARDSYDRLAAQRHVIAAIATYSPSSPVLSRIDVPRRAQVECVPASMADVLGATPLMGRWFSTDEDQPGGPRVAIASFTLWQSDLHGDPAVLGRTIAIDDQPATIVGVMRPGFNGVLSLGNRDLWVPSGQSTAARQRYGCRAPSDRVNAFVRLRPGISAEDATRLVAASSAHGQEAASRLVLLPLADQLRSDLRAPFVALVGAVLAVLLIACANVANLGLERLVGRQREIAVRVALGASRGRIVRQTVIEQALIATIGAVAGVLVAFLTLDAFVALLPRSIPHLDTVALNGRVLAASVALAVLCAVGVGLVPAIQASAVDLRAHLAARDRGTTRHNRIIRYVFVGAELSLGVALTVGALLMIQTFLTLRPSAPGFDPRNKVVALVRLPADLALVDRQGFVEAASRDLLRLPGVRAVAATTYVPMSRSVAALDMTIGDAPGRVFAGAITANYLEIMGIPLLAGRGLTAADAPGAPEVAVVNDAFVHRWLPDRDAIGATVRLDLDGDQRRVRIVGVIGNMRSWGADTLPRPEIYLPFSQVILGSPYFIIDASPRARALLPASMREIVARLRPELLLDRLDDFEALLAAEVARPRFGAWLFGLLAGLAVTLAVVGLAATLAWSVAERRREIGVRMALGAQPRQIGALVVGQTLVLSGVGIGIGLALAAFGTRLLEGWLYGVTRLDVATFAGCAGLMLIVSLAAAYVPARRAASVDPLITLRSE